MNPWAPPKATEDTITSEILKEELKARGINIATQMTFDTPIGRYQPDLYLSNGTNFIIQAKLGNSGKLIEAIGQVHDGIKWTDVVGGFAVLYPKQLRKSMPIPTLRTLAKSTQIKYSAYAFFEETDPRPQMDFSGNLSELVDWIQNTISEVPKPIAPSVRKVVDILQRSVEYLTPTFKHLKKKDLEYIFGDKPVFDNILLFDKGKVPLGDMRRAAAHFLVDQILFYIYLSNKMTQKDPTVFPEINEDRIKSPKHLLDYFWKALKTDYAPIFAFDVASHVPEQEVRLIRNVIKTIKAVAPKKLQYDLLGQLFHELIPLEIRKHVAAYYTNPSAAEMLANLVIENSESRVLDAAVGSGGLLASAYRTKKRLYLKKEDEFSESVHNRFVGDQLTGIDVMPFAAHLAAINLTIQGFTDNELYATNKVRIAIWDATELNPGDIIPPMSRSLRETFRTVTLDSFTNDGKKRTIDEQTILKGTVTPDRIGADEIALDYVDIVIMNPPFTKQERIRSGQYKKELKIRFTDFHKYRTETLGYYGYFIFLADKFLKPGGKIALVLPATILRVSSAEALRQWLVEQYHIEHIITTWQRAAFTEDASFREILLIAKKLTKKQAKDKAMTLKTIISFLKRIPNNFVESLIFSDKLKSVQRKVGLDQKYENNLLKSRILTRQQLQANVDNLYKIIAAYNWELFDIWEKVIGAG